MYGYSTFDSKALSKIKTQSLNLKESHVMQANKTKFRKKLLASLVASTAVAGFSNLAYAQDAQTGDDAEAALETIVVTGIRGSLQRAMDIKRNSSGIVDAISAEDIGAFPDTNLAESLQRITGVSISRTNGEGDEVTIRGFGSGNNMVTLNGRQMPISQVRTIGGDQAAAFASGGSRSFDFSQLSSDGVSGLQVYKTGKADVVSGGLGGTINVNTLEPLNNPGLNANIGVKGLVDTSVESGDDVTPEFNGFVSWTDPSERFGVQLFGAFEERDSAANSATVNDWQMVTANEFATGSLTTDDTVIENLPEDPNQLVARPLDSRYHLSEFNRERINLHGTVQFRPIDDLTVTGTAMYVQNETQEQRLDQTNWFNTPFDHVVFNESETIPTTIFLQEDLGAGNVKDTGFEQQMLAIEDTLEDYGVNIEWQVNDRLKLTLDAHTGESEAKGGLPDGNSAVTFSMGAPVVTAHSADFSGGVPIQNIVIDDVTRGNGNGVLDAGDLGSQVARVIDGGQKQELDQFTFNGEWEFTDNSTVQFGIDYIETDTTFRFRQDDLVLGDWGITNPGDIPTDLVDTFCLVCQFDDFSVPATGQSEIAFQANAVELLDVLGPEYGTPGTVADDFNNIEEEIFAAYVQFHLEGEVANRPARVTLGTRFEDTEVTSTSNIAPTEQIIWVSDQDFRQRVGEGTENFSVDSGYDNLMPNLDFSIDITENLVGRLSFSKTIGRPGFTSLRASQNANNPTRPTAFDSELPTGDAQNPSLTPLRSNNFDLAFEWYYGEDSFLAAGYYEKRIDDFIGTETVDRNLFGLRDATSGAPGTRSGMALEALGNIEGANLSDVNLFTLTALIDNFGLESALEQFNANFDPNGSGNANQGFVDQILADFDVAPNADDPLFTFQVDQPLNRESAKIDGIELALQHFFWDTGFGVQLNYTTVNSDVGFDLNQPSTVDQFALIGLSDTANAILMYEKHGLSVRLAANWRDEFLTSTSRGSTDALFTDDRAQVDLSVAYDVTDNLQVTFEGINLTEQENRQFARNSRQVFFAGETDARFTFGARYKF